MNTIGARAVEDDSFGGESRKMNSMVCIMLCLYLFCPVSVTAAEIPGWQEVIFKDDPATRFVSGIWHQNRVVAGTHNPGSVYTFELDPFGSGVKRVFFPDKEAPTEAVLDLVAFQDRLYGVVEKSPSEIRRIHRESGVWEPVEILVMEGFYFGAVFKGQLFVTGGLPKRGGITVFRSADGRRFEQAAVLPDWAWVPAVFQEQFYLVGHKGSAYFNGGTAGFRSSDGIRYDPVPALEGEFQYQCAYPWKGHLYLGTGGWTTARKAKNQARIYRYEWHET